MSNIAICLRVESGFCCRGLISGSTAYYLKVQWLWPWS